MYEGLYCFFDKKNMFCSKQFACRSKRSTIDALAEITEEIRQGSTDTYICILLDLPKAFNSINYEILLSKQEKYIVREIFLRWFESKLKQRRQCAEVKDVLSDFLHLLLGVRNAHFLGFYCF